MCPKSAPLTTMPPTACPMSTSDGVIAAGSVPLRANASHAAAARPNDTTVPMIARRVPVMASPFRSSRDHSPAHDGEVLQRLEHQLLEGEAHDSDDRDAGEHDVGVQELAR